MNIKSVATTCWIAVLFSSISANLLAPACVADAASPNVVVILADDQGWGDLSVHGNTNLNTPRIDSLASDGAIFDSFYVCPVCSPTRAEFLTGRYHPRGGVYSTTSGGERLDLDETTIAQVFQAAGYATAAFGKWHNGTQYPYHPNARGFDEFYGFCSGHWGHYFSPQLEHNGRLVQGQGYIIDDLTNHALEFISANQQQPFFCYLPFNIPHSPMQVPDRFYERFESKSLEMLNRDATREDLSFTRAALAMCENIDWNVGRILDQLEQLGLADNTIVVYFSDNGPNSWRWNGGMRGRKGYTDEGGVRAPCLVRWPAEIPAGIRIAPISAAIDLLPTLADLAGVTYDSSLALDGKSLKPLLLQDTSTWPARLLFSHWRGRVSVRSQDYRLDQQGRLYDMQNDIGQARDVAEQHPEIAGQLARAVAEWKQELLPELAEDDRPFPVGYVEFPTTLLPARDGVASGKIQRSNKFPNCSYFRNWTETADEMTWDIAVHEPGLYEATLYYACAASDVGATIELAFAGQQVRKQIATAHDPPVRGPQQDRFPRLESVVKDFRPMTLGTIRLPARRGPLTLRAVDIPGAQVAEVRYIVLTLLAPGSENSKD